MSAPCAGDARDWMRRDGYLIPSARRLSDLVRNVVRRVTTEDHAAVTRSLGATPLQTCLQQLLVRRAGRSMTHLEWLRRPPGRRSLKTMRLLEEEYEWLEGILPKRGALPIPKERQRVYARRFRRRRSSHIPQLPLFRRELEAICFATVALGTLADDLLRLVEMRIAAIWNWAHRIAATEVTPARVRGRCEILAELRRLVADTTLEDAVYRSRSAVLLLPMTPAAAPSRAADVREVLSRNARRVRPVLQLLLKLKLDGDDDHPIRRALGWV